MHWIPQYDVRAKEIAKFHTYLKSWGYNELSLEVFAPNAAEDILDSDGTLTYNYTDVEVWIVLIDMSVSARNAFASKLRHVMHYHEDYERIDGAVSDHFWNDRHLRRGKRTNSLIIMTTDGDGEVYDLRDDGVFTYYSVILRDDAIYKHILEDYDQFMQNIFLSYDPDTGLYFLDLDPERDHVAVPDPNTDETFYLKYTANAPDNTYEDIRVFQTELAPAKYSR
jgi:hypothetical protein